MPTFQELQQEFYATQLGLDRPWPSVSDLQYLFFLGVKNGDITIGGADPAEIQTVVDAYLTSNPVEVPPTTPEIFADSQTTMSSTRAAYIAANYPGYTGPVVFNTARFLDHPAPPDYQLYDFWTRRRTL